MMKELLKTIIKDFHKSLPRTDVIPRDLQTPLQSKKIISLTGPRRSGKTFYLFQLINTLVQQGETDKIIYINFEDERLELSANQMQLILDAYFELYPENYNSRLFLFLDEIQVIEGWEKFVRRVYDTITQNIFITGSSSRMLGKDLATSLRGRNLLYNLYPLSFREYCKFQNIDTSDLYSTQSKAIFRSQFEKYFLNGGYPETVFMDSSLISKTLQSYFDVMLFRDIVDRYQVSNIVVLKQFLKKLINNISDLFSVNKFYNELKSQGITVSKNTIYELLEYSLDCFLFFIVFPYESSVTIQQMKNKKIYAIDTGLINAITYRFAQDRGKLLENIVFMQLNRQDKAIYFIRNQHECDFIIQEKGSPVQAFQICTNLADEATRKRELRGLTAALQRFDLPEGYIITWDEEETIIQNDKTIKIIPCWKWLIQP